jgi:hypothetical protein
VRRTSEIFSRKRILITSPRVLRKEADGRRNGVEDKAYRRSKKRRGRQPNGRSSKLGQRNAPACREID